MNEQKMSEPQRILYFDHNVLDLMLKGAEEGVMKMIEVGELTPVWSDENIKEIVKSIGREEEFCSLLRRLEAMRIYEELVDFKNTGRVLAHDCDPSARLNEVRVESESDDLVESMSGFLEKMYGGRENQSFKDLVTDPLSEIGELLKEVAEESSDQRIGDLIEMFSKDGEIHQLFDGMGEELDSESIGKSVIERVSEHTGYSSVQLNNIKGPNVLEQIWKLIGPSLGAPEISINRFFGLEKVPGYTDSTVPTQISGKVSAIYHQLNFVGYWRDTKMAQKRRFDASYSDMTHAGMASYAALFLCNDRALRLKAEAAYEYLNIPTRVLSIQLGSSDDA